MLENESRWQSAGLHWMVNLVGITVLPQRELLPAIKMLHFLGAQTGKMQLIIRKLIHLFELKAKGNSLRLLLKLTQGHQRSQLSPLSIAQ